MPSLNLHDAVCHFWYVLIHLFNDLTYLFSTLDRDASIRSIMFAGDQRYPDTFFIFTYTISIISASFGLAKCIKVGVTRTIGPGGPLDGLLSSRFVVAFFACGLVLVSRALIFGIVTVNYGNNPNVTGADAALLVPSGTIEVTLPPSSPIASTIGNPVETGIKHFLNVQLTI